MHDQHLPSTPDDSFLSALPLGYVAVRKDGVITQANRALAQALQYDRSDVLGRIAAEFPFDDANRRLFFEQMNQRATGASGSYVLQLRGRGNSRVPVGCFAVPQFEPDGTFWGSRGIIVPFEQIEKLAAQALNGSRVMQRVAGSSFDSEVDDEAEPASGTVLGTWSANDNAVMASLLPKLTKRERDVVALLLVGLRVNGVADRLKLSHYTVRNHLKRIFRKAGVNSQGQLLLKLNALT
jgi:DNA-binding CsgD family transcriptional regulator